MRKPTPFRPVHPVATQDTLLPLLACLAPIPPIPEPATRDTVVLGVAQEEMYKKLERVESGGSVRGRCSVRTARGR